MMNQPTHRIDALNGLRGLAALVVALEHFVLSVTGAAAGSTTHHVAALMGSMAVGVFFLISGFVMPITLASTSPTVFLFRRCFRLYPVFLVCCLLRLWMNVDMGSMVWGPEAFKLLWLNVSMFGGLWLLPAQNIEPVVWTLAIEVKFYLLCALLWWLAGKTWGCWYRGFLIALAVLALWAFRFPVIEAPWTYDLAYAVSAIPFMTIGVFVSLFMYQRINLLQLMLGLALAVTGYLLAPLGVFVSRDLVLPSYVAATFIFGLALYFRTSNNFLSTRWCGFLGRISYPMYGAHSAVILWVQKYVAAGVMVKLVVYLALAFVLSYVIHRVIELPFVAWSKRLTVRKH